MNACMHAFFEVCFTRSEKGCKSEALTCLSAGIRVIAVKLIITAHTDNAMNQSENQGTCRILTGPQSPGLLLEIDLGESKVGFVNTYFWLKLQRFSVKSFT